MVSDAIVFCIGLLADRKYSNFRPILDRYIENLFSSTNAHTIMLESLQRNLDRAAALNQGENQNEAGKRTSGVVEQQRTGSSTLSSGGDNSGKQKVKYHLKIGWSKEIFA